MTFEEMRKKLEAIQSSQSITDSVTWDREERQRKIIVAQAAISQAESLAKIERHLSILAASVNPANLFEHGESEEVSVDDKDIHIVKLVEPEPA